MSVFLLTPAGMPPVTGGACPTPLPPALAASAARGLWREAKAVSGGAAPLTPLLWEHFAGTRFRASRCCSGAWAAGQHPPRAAPSCPGTGPGVCNMSLPGLPPWGLLVPDCSHRADSDLWMFVLLLTVVVAQKDLSSLLQLPSTCAGNVPDLTVQPG